MPSRPVIKLFLVLISINNISSNVRQYRFQNAGNIFACGIWLGFAIRNITNYGWNPESKFHWQGIPIPIPGIRSPHSKTVLDYHIWGDCLLDRFHYNVCRKLRLTAFFSFSFKAWNLKAGISEDFLFWVRRGCPKRIKRKPWKTKDSRSLKI